MSSASYEVEVERAFLLKALPVAMQTVTPQEVHDVYLTPASDLLVKLRLRHAGDEYSLTKKAVVDPNELSVQEEYTIPLSLSEFELFNRLGGRSVRKLRYVFELGGRQAELDYFLDDLEGFAMVEFEFANEQERDAFVPPVDICGADVTQEDFIAGPYLAGKSFADIEPELLRLGHARVKK